MSKPQRPKLTKIVLDVLKVRELPLLDFGRLLSELEGVRKVSIVLGEVDMKTETVKITIEGDNLDYEAIKKVIERAGADIHSIDEVLYSRGR